MLDAPRGLIRYTAFAGLFALFLACSPSPEGHTFTTSRVEGVRTAVNSGGPLFDQPLFHYEKALTLKEDPAQPESMLFNPGSIVMDSAGNFYVTDRGDLRIVVYDPEGNYLRSFGKEGSGPGEFRSINLLHIDGDVLTLYDFQNQRTIRYRTDGSLLETIRHTAGSRDLEQVSRAPGGLSVHEVSKRETAEDAGLDPSYDWSARRALVTDAKGDTIAIVDSDWIAVMYRYTTSRGGSGARRMAYSGSPEAQYVPGRGIYVSTGVEPVFTWYTLTGEPSSRIRIDLPPEPITAEIRAAILSDMNERDAQMRARYPNLHFESPEKAVRHHDQKAFWSRVTVDDAGYLWLEVPEESFDQPAGSGRLNRVVSPEGEYLGDSRWPADFGNVYQGFFLCVLQDEATGANLPTVFRILPAADGIRYP